MEMPRVPHIQQPRHSQHHETVRRALGGTIEFRHFTGFDQLFAPHAHDYPVIGLVREGHRLMECNRARYRLGPGQLLALNAGDAHGCIQEGATPLVYDSLALLDFPDCPPFAGPIVEDAEAVALMEDLASLMQEPTIDEAHVEEELCLLVGLLAAHDEPETPGRTARDLTTRSQSGSREHPSPADPAAPNPAAQAMAAYLREHTSATVRLEEVAAAAGLDKYRALRSFTAAFGLTPMRYLASLRVEAAREALAAGASCADAAWAAGFSDQAHMTRAFKERLGMTPAFYQRAITSSQRTTAEGSSRAADPQTDDSAPTNRAASAVAADSVIPSSKAIPLSEQVRP